VSQDDCSEDNGEGDGSEDEAQDDRALEAMAEGATTDEMDADEGVKMPGPPDEACESSPLFQAGCV